ncbi:MAG: 16S rRNA (uracil(1498)-N(3))-methyltransferase [Halieaceae bacterium]|nr:16S rRNA (uracil(1498)-N(3))-methyltransferase [Halieaceae bacterium]
MNIVLLEPNALGDHFQAQLSERAHKHCIEVIKPEVGSQLNVGVYGGKLGVGKVLEHSKTRTVLDVEISELPPRKETLCLVLALPRPKMVRRILSASIELGVETVHIINSYRVEKSYWQSPYLKPDAIETTIHTALEQAGDTVPPSLHWHKGFKPFAEDHLPNLVRSYPNAWLGDHRVHSRLDVSTCDSHRLIAIGPEGGFIPYEVGLLQQAGLTPINLGARIMRVETAVSALLGKLIT